MAISVLARWAGAAESMIKASGPALATDPRIVGHSSLSMQSLYFLRSRNMVSICGPEGGFRRSGGVGGLLSIEHTGGGNEGRTRDHEPLEGFPKRLQSQMNERVDKKTTGSVGTNGSGEFNEYSQH